MAARLRLEAQRIARGRSRPRRAASSPPPCAPRACRGSARGRASLEAPRAERLRHERRARHRGALQDALDIAVAVDREVDGPAHAHVVEGRARVVDEQVRRGQRSHPGDDHARHGRLELVGDVLRRLARPRHVEPPGLDRRRPRAALADDDVLEPVEVRPALHEVVRVLHVLDELAPAPFLELERPRAHAAIALVGHAARAPDTPATAPRRASS